jgi:hypothetical protein
VPGSKPAGKIGDFKLEPSRSVFKRRLSEASMRKSFSLLFVTFIAIAATNFLAPLVAAQNSSHHSGLDPLLESAVAGLVRRISIRKFNPGSTRA